MRIRRWGLGLVVLLILPGCARQFDRVTPLMPESWTMTAKSGHIATVCFGSWEECGSLKWTYDTHSTEAVAIGAVEARLRDAGWRVDTVRGPEISASHGKKSQSARLHVRITGGTAAVTYVHT